MAIPRAEGRSVRILARLLRSPAGGILRRALAEQVVERPLAAIDRRDLEGVMPTYTPRPYARPARGAGR
jgi:hypothetical protein